MNQGAHSGKWCEGSQVYISDPAISDVAIFLYCWFKEKNLIPSTAADYRTILQMVWDLKGEGMSTSLELNKLLEMASRRSVSPDRT